MVSAVLAATSAANSLFPGLALDRFAIVNIVAGFFVAAAPVVFGLLYSWLTALRPGLAADATVKLPRLCSAAISVPSGASITLAADTAIQDGSAQWATVRGGGAYQIPPGATIRVAAGVQEITRPCYEAAVHQAGRPDDAGVQAGLQALWLTLEQAVILDAALPAGELGPKIASAIGGAGVRAAAEKVARAVAGAPGSQAVPDVDKIIEAMQQAVPDITNLGPVDNAMAYSGTSDIGVLPGSVLAIDQWPGTLTIQGSDVVAQPPSPPATPEVPEQVPAGVQLVQLVSAPGPSAAPLTGPVFISAAGGANVTVTGAADITLPGGTEISAPQQRHYVLPKLGRLVVPQGTNVIVANLIILLIVNFLTMFGIGAELGIASVLADFSDATGHGHAWMFAGLAVVAFLVIVYAATATRTMADPQPGSSISAQAGASFTL